MQSWQYFGQTECLHLECGVPHYICHQEHLTHYEVESSCQCKQLCLEHVDEGCRAWRLSSTGTCFLHRVSFDTNSEHWVPEHGWIAGGIDLIVTDVSPSVVHGSEEFDLTISGMGLPVSGRVGRLKIVLQPNSCGFHDVAHTVSGIRCSGNGNICHPGPLIVSETHLTWKVSIIPSATEQQYSVCYCPDTFCRAWSWYTIGTITTQAAEYVFSALGAAFLGESLLLNITEAVHIEPAIPTLKYWDVRIVPHTPNGCSETEAAGFSFVVRSEGYSDVSLKRYKSWDLTIGVHASGGNYTVCFCAPDVPEEAFTSSSEDFWQLCQMNGPNAYIPLLSSTGDRFISIDHSVDEAPPAIFHHQNSWCANSQKDKIIPIRGIDLSKLRL